ncbi:MAG: DUF934 domain-containing protein [Parvibaculales bacterium]
MPLIKNKNFQDDPFTRVADELELPEGAVIVTLERLKRDADQLMARKSDLGVVIQADNIGKTQLGEDVRELTPYLECLSVIALEFPSFRNGRAYSSARILRDELKYKGEIRAIGDVAYDQWAYMARCGIDAFEVNQDVTLEQFNTAMAELSDVYQPAADTQNAIPWRR